MTHNGLETRASYSVTLRLSVRTYVMVTKMITVEVP